ncbi:MAG TPA: glycosyltransferase [Aequorivita sp.]|nr:glycosyltransferase [Aequorivita sp.]
MNYEIIRKKIDRSLYRLRILLLPNYVKRKNGNRRIFVSYITEPLKRRNDKVFFQGHQNHQETVIIEDIINELDLSYVFNHYSLPLNFVRGKFDVVFGLEPNFGEVCQRNPQAIKIYYATGAYLNHQNRQITQRTDDFKSKYQVEYPYVRMVEEHDSCEIADVIIQIGSEHTLETYPEHLRAKIKLLDQTCHEYRNFDLEEKIQQSSKTDYIWFGSFGSILKGLDLVLEYFLVNPHLTLHVVGPVEDKFLDVFQPRISQVNNISLYGFMNVDSEEFKNVATKCAFLIYPSASEGGWPGSVLNLQKLGVIPILSRWASGPTIKDLGYLLPDLSIKSVAEAIAWSSSLSDETIASLARKNHRAIVKKHSKERFKSQLKSHLENIINK